MDWSFLTKRIVLTHHSSVAQFAMPTVVFEAEPEFVLGARLLSPSRQTRRLGRVGVRRLDPGALNPHAGKANIANLEAFRRAINEVADIIGNGSGRFGLVLPDGAARVSILNFETLPDDPAETETLVRWKMREKLPFAPEEARISIQILAREPGHVEVLAVAARGAVLSEYESAIEAANGGMVLLLPATVTLLPLLPEKEPRGQLLLHVCSRWMTSVVVVGSRPCYWRTRDLDSDTPEEVAREVAGEAARILASTRDRLHADLGRAWLCARPAASTEMAAAIAAAVSHEVEILTPRPELGGDLSAEERTLFAQFGATVAGIISNSGKTE
ncbi:MAG: hypothetical protein ACE145_13390 [Terriglobia bacterium]